MTDLILVEQGLEPSTSSPVIQVKENLNQEIRIKLPINYSEGTMVAWYNFIKKEVNDYGVIDNITSANYIINWEKRGRVKLSHYDFKFAGYIKEIPWFIGGKTIVKIPRQTTVLLVDEILQFSQDTYFILQEIQEETYRLYDPINKDTWIFPQKGFKGIPFANLYQVNQKALAASLNLSQNDLQSLYRGWLFDKTLLYNPADPQEILPYLRSFIPQLNEELEQYCQGFFPKKQYEEGQQLEALEAAIADRYSTLLDHWKKTLGYWGLKLGTPMVKSTPQDKPKARPYRYEFAVIKQLIPLEDDCLIGLESSESCYLIPWSKSLGIWSKIEYNFFSEQICVAVSFDRKYFEAFIGFKNKQEFKAQLKPLKARLGWLESYELVIEPLPFQLPTDWTEWDQFGVNSFCCDSPDLLWKFYYKSVRPKHKTYRGFLGQIHFLLTNY